MTQFNAGPITDEEIETMLVNDLEVPKDWAESLTSAAQALRELEDALPASNKEKSEKAIVKLHASVKQLRNFLLMRGLEA